MWLSNHRVDLLSEQNVNKTRMARRRKKATSALKRFMLLPWSCDVLCLCDGAVDRQFQY